MSNTLVLIVQGSSPTNAVTTNCCDTAFFSNGGTQAGIRSTNDPITVNPIGECSDPKVDGLTNPDCRINCPAARKFAELAGLKIATCNVICHQRHFFSRPYIADLLGVTTDALPAQSLAPRRYEK